MENNEGIKEAIKGGKGMPKIALLISYYRVRIQSRKEQWISAREPKPKPE
jgi:hypothetical protein